MWKAGKREGRGGLATQQFTFEGDFKEDVPHGPGKMLFNGCQQVGEYIMTNIFVRKDGMLETKQEPSWHCSKLTCSASKQDLVIE